jgi:signal transduction histidine kinase
MARLAEELAGVRGDGASIRARVVAVARTLCGAETGAFVAPEHGSARARLPGADVASYLAVPVIDRDGRPRGAIVLGHSRAGRFTEHHEHVIRGIAAYAALALETAELSNELATTRAEESLRLRDEFLTIVSHELITPLTALQLALDGLEEQARVSPALTTGLDRARQSTSRLAHVVASVLDVSRMAQGRFELSRETCLLDEPVRAAVAAAHANAERAGCRLAVALDNALCGSWDRARIQLLASNLLSNAIKHGAGAAIEITLWRSGNDAILEVRDHGPGIAEQDLPGVFDRFTRAVPLRHYGGLGVGLYVVDEIAAAHGGSVRARNLSDGMRFTVRLPINPPQLRSSREDLRSTRENVA